MHSRKSYSPAQCRAARGLLNWSLERLAWLSGVPLKALQRFETGAFDLSEADRLTLARTFRAAFVIPIAGKRAGEGVRFNRPAYRRWPLITPLAWSGARSDSDTIEDAHDDF